ncbi:hypothetical protein GUJ93_ZPchr0009g1871 [Zizania palustris]|uniref:Uncharacterized protein n=1 Tax=Zizania palustris TaxID=103762 RepID=A0A8J5R7X3_ZIZPA|nr:hypothetical protein GUJ93_ZPchr0009g1871 [Zizania palustris]
MSGRYCVECIEGFDVKWRFGCQGFRQCVAFLFWLVLFVQGGDVDRLSTAGDRGSSGELDAGGSGRPSEVWQDLKSARRDGARLGRMADYDGVSTGFARGRPGQAFARLEGIESGSGLLALGVALTDYSKR